MVLKPENANFEHWHIFVEGTEGPSQWLVLFYEFIKSGQISVYLLEIFQNNVNI